MFQRYKMKIIDKVDYRRQIMEWDRAEKKSPLDSLENQIGVAKDFIRVVNDLLSESQIILTHHGVGYQYNVFHKKYGLIGYIIRKKYFLDASLIFKKINKLDARHCMYEYMSNDVIFRELLRGKMIKPHWRRYYPIDNHAGEGYCLCIQGNIIDTKMSIIVDDGRIDEIPSIKPLG